MANEAARRAAAEKVAAIVNTTPEKVFAWDAYPIYFVGVKLDKIIDLQLDLDSAEEERDRLKQEAATADVQINEVVGKYMEDLTAAEKKIVNRERWLDEHSAALDEANIKLDAALALVAEYRVALGQITIADDKSAGVYEHMLGIDPKMLEGK